MFKVISWLASSLYALYEIFSLCSGILPSSIAFLIASLACFARNPLEIACLYISLLVLICVDKISLISLSSNSLKNSSHFARPRTAPLRFSISFKVYNKFYDSFLPISNETESNKHFFKYVLFFNLVETFFVYVTACSARLSLWFPPSRPLTLSKSTPSKMKWYINQFKPQKNAF